MTSQLLSLSILLPEEIWMKQKTHFIEVGTDLIYFPAILIIIKEKSKNTKKKHALLLTMCANLVFKDDIRGFKQRLDAGR